MRKLLVLVLLAAIAGYVYLPYHTANRLEEALRSADKDALDRLVDFASVRRALKDQMKAKLAEKALNVATAGGAPSQSAAAATALGNQVISGLLAGTVAERMVDNLITADGVAALLKAGHSIKGASATGFEITDRSWASLTEFTGRGGDGSKVRFCFLGMQGWRVVSVEPSAALEKRTMAGK